MIAPSDVTAVIPTRGNVDLTPILDSLAGCGEVIVWDNSCEDADSKVYARYLAIAKARNSVVYTQDDDCLVDVEAVCRHYAPGALTANMPQSRWPDYPDSALVGWGSVFDRDLPAQAFRHFFDFHGQVIDPLFLMTCDVVFSTLARRRRIIDVGFTHLPWAEGPGRMFTSPGHTEIRDVQLALAREARDAMKGLRE